MAKKVLWGFSAFVVMVAVGIALVVTLSGSWNGLEGGKRSNNDPEFLRQKLADEFSGQPEVEFVCRFPVVGPAPCIFDGDVGSREVTLTFINYELPNGVTPEEQARRIAIAAFKTSDFATNSDKTEVIFIESSDSTSLSRKYSFTSEDLAAGDAASLEATSDSKAVEE